MKKILLMSLFLLSAFLNEALAQSKTVTGRVTDATNNEGLPGVTVLVKGTQVGTATDGSGNYSISVPDGGTTLVFSFVGFTSTERAIGNSTTLNIALATDAKQLGEVVVTGALGVKRAAKENGYAEKNIGAKELTQTNVTNIANGLTAKAAGLQVNTVNNGIDPSVRIVLRGNRSINGNNQALVVLDGVPVPNTVLNSLNPNDIESVNILKGASAAALYGSEASNGALIITTKRGTSGGKPTVVYSNSFQLQKIAYMPEMQTRFGQYGGEGGADIDPVTGFARYVPYENQNYGPEFNGQMVQLGPALEDGTKKMVPYSALKKDPRLAFFDTGMLEQNDISYSQGDQDNSFFLSAQNVYSKGVVPEDRNKRTSVRLSAAKKYGILKADFALGYTNTNISQAGSSYDGSLLYTNVIQTAANIDLDQYKDLNDPFANPSNFYSAYHVNPWWQIYNSRINQTRDVILGNLNLTISPTKFLDATYRVSNNYGIYQRRDTKAQVNFSEYSISDPDHAGNVPSGYSSGVIPGQVYDYTQYGDGSTGYGRLQQDAFVNLHHTFFSDFKTTLLLGSTIWQRKLRYVESGSNNLLIPDFYNVSVIGGTPNTGTGQNVIRQIAFYGSLNLGYKDFAFLEFTGRNDKDSRLGLANRSFFYPSVKGSLVFSDAIPTLKDNAILTYGKIRAAVSQVGQVSVGPYSLNNTYFVTGGFPYGSLGALSLNPTNNNPDLLPEKVNEFEVGTDLGFLDNRIELVATYYKQKSKNQTISVQTSPTTGFSAATINAGEIENSGLEFDLKGTVIEKTGNIGLNVGGNLGVYNSKVVELLPGVAEQFQIAGGGGNIFAVVGQPYPVVKGTDLQRDPEGRVIVDGITGYPLSDPTVKVLGRTTPKYILGLNSSLSYKFITLAAVAEYRGGYVIYNQVGSTLNFGGISETSASAGRQRFIFPNSVIANTDGTFTPNTSVSIRDGNYGFWQSSQYNRVASPFVNNGAFWKLREATLNFDLSQFVSTTRFVKGLSFALTGRNLLLFKPKSNPWADPEYNIDNSNAVGQTSAAQTPPTRIFGANLQVTF